MEKARQTGVRLFCTALYCEDRFNGEASFRHFQDILHFIRERFDRVDLIMNSGHLEKLRADPDQPATVLLMENADALAGDISYVDSLKEEGIRIVGLTHAGNNRVADGNNVLHSDGITTDGREVIHAITRNRIVIDVAHLHQSCFWQLLDLTEGPIISSHTGIRALCNIPRNIDLDQAREILERQGMVGITFNPQMLSMKGNASLEDVFAHVDVLVQKFGPEGVGIGSDFCGFEEPAFGLEDVSKVRKLADMMLEHGYGNEAARKIMGINWLQFYKKLFS